MPTPLFQRLYRIFSPRPTPIALDKENLLSEESSGTSTPINADTIPDRFPAKESALKWTTYSKGRTRLFICLILISVSGLTAGIWSAVHGNSTTAQSTTSCSCGRTWSDARSRNCTYDTISVHWLPPHCRDLDLNDEFDRAGPGPGGQWHYYMDPNGTSEYNVADLGELAATGGYFWVTREWHIAHCTYIWRKQWRAKQTGVVFERVWNTPGHIAHCEKMFKRRGPLQQITAKTRVGSDADEIPLVSED